MTRWSIPRRGFVGLTAAAVAGGLGGLTPLLHAAEARPPWPEDWNPDRPLVATGKPLRVLPVFMHTTFQPREQASWRSWGKINNPQAAEEERQRIARSCGPSSPAPASRSSCCRWPR